MATEGKVTHLSVDDRVARGRMARKLVPRSRHADWAPAGDRVDPVALLEEQSAARVPDLVPIRYGRMSASAFTFYRGAAYVMAADLAASEPTGLEAQLCGDAHLSNFGGFASPERSLVFDLNDFDETLPGPFEWDVKRLAASFEIAGRARGLDAKPREATVRGVVGAYRTAMREFAAMQNLDVWYAQLNVEKIIARYGDVAGPRVLKAMQRTVTKAESKDRLRARSKLTEEVNGELRIVSQPPLVVPVEDLPDYVDAAGIENLVRKVIRSYRRTLQGDRRRLVESYRFVHLARKVVGVGSVGTRAWIVLLLGRDDQDALMLQFKEATSSVLEPYLGKSRFTQHGQRVVEGQRLMQAASDIFLGWDRVKGIDGVTRDYYVRQLWDWKASVDVENMRPEAFGIYGDLCGWTLARAHARSGDRIAIASYLGGSDTFDRAIGEFASRYADQNELDHGALMTAIESGRLEAQGDI